MATVPTLALAASVVLALIIVLQLLLAAGLPLGAAAWGGRHRVLPGPLRLGSVAAAAVLAVAGWVVLARASVIGPGGDVLAIRIAAWAGARASARTYAMAWPSLVMADPTTQMTTQADAFNSPCTNRPAPWWPMTWEISRPM